MRARATDKKPARKQPQWAEEFKEFRRTFYYSHREMATLLSVCQRTVLSIESGATRNPRRDIQLRFHQLRYKFEQQRLLEEAEREARLRALRAGLGKSVPAAHLFRSERMLDKSGA